MNVIIFLYNFVIIIFDTYIRQSPPGKIELNTAPRSPHPYLQLLQRRDSYSNNNIKQFAFKNFAGMTYPTSLTPG